jgi:hypothetical protein
MSFATRLVPLIALFAAPFCAAAQTPDYEVGPSLVCDTQGQVERFVALFSGDAQAAVRTVNAEAEDPSACAIMNVAFMPRQPARNGTARRQCFRDHPHPGGRHRNPRRDPPGSPRRLLLAVRRHRIRRLIRT